MKNQTTKQTENSKSKPTSILQAYNPSTFKVEYREPRVQGHAQSHTHFKTSLRCRRPYLKQTRQQNKKPSQNFQEAEPETLPKTPRYWGQFIQR